MPTIAEQLSNATRTNLESQVALMTSLNTKAFEGMQKLIDLNVAVTRSTLEDSAGRMREMMEAKDPQQALSLSNLNAKPSIEKALSYSRHIANIASTMQAEMARATEEQMAEASRKMVGLLEQATSNAPAGAENIVALMRSAIGTANASYEQLSKTTRQAADAMQSNVNNAFQQFSSVASNAAKSVQQQGNDVAQTAASNIQSATNTAINQAAAATTAVSRAEKQR